MSFLRKGIESIRVVALPDAVTAGGNGLALSRMTLVTWKSCWDDVLYQVHLNGRRAATTVNPRQRRLVVPIPVSAEAAVRVEVVGVDPADRDCDFASQMREGRVLGDRIRLVLLRDQSLPADAQVRIYSDNGTGEIDYEMPLNGMPIPVWPCWQDKAGFGLARFGGGDFGYDSAASIGCGQGCFGYGQFGLDADCLTWTSPVMPLGSYRLAVKVIDDRGDESLMTETSVIPLLPASRPISQLDVGTFDEETNELTLNVSDSAQ